jgi:phosphoribosylamine--glycine ligase
MGNFLILSDCGDGVGLALRLKAEGHQARIQIFNPSFNDQGQGIVDFADDYSFGQTVIADVTGFGPLMEKFRDEGHKIFSGGMFADKLEKDRTLSQEVMEKAGIETPKAVSAGSWEDAVRLVEEFGEINEKIVIKPEGVLSGVVPSYCASSVEDAKAMLEQFKKEHPGPDVEITVQEFIEGVAVSTEGWFTGKEWCGGMFNHTIERKHFLNDDKGPSGGCTGNVVWSCEEDDPLVTETLTKLTDVLRKHLYIGPIDINCIVNKEGVYGLEFTPRFGYDAFPTLLYSLCDFVFGSFIDSVARGVDSGDALTEGFGAGVRLSLPPWPNEKFKHEGGVQIRGLEDLDDRAMFYPFGVCFSNDRLASCQGVGILGVANGHGETIGQAFGRAYRLIDKMSVSELQYRTDLASVCKKDFEELESLVGEALGSESR